MKITPENFIKHFKRGKEAALEFVIDEYSGIVKAIIYNSLQSYNDAHVIEECISDTFLGAFDNAKQFSGEPEDFRKWICTIAKFKAIDAQRKLGNQPIAYTIESEHELGEHPRLDGKFHAVEFGDKYEHYGYYPKYITKKISDHEYAGLFIYQLIEGPKPDEIHATWNGDSIHDFSGDWSFDLNLHALEGETTKNFSGAGITSQANGIDGSLTKMTETPISTTIYLSETVDIPTATLEEAEWRGILIEYSVNDDLGNEYNMIYYQDVGHSANFQNNHVSRPRITTTQFHEDATSITITPIVNVYKFANEVDEDPTARSLELIMEPYAIESMEFDLK